MSIKGGSYFERQEKMIAIERQKRVRNYSYRTKAVYHFEIADTSIPEQKMKLYFCYRYMSLMEIPTNWIESRVSRYKFFSEVEGDSAILVLHSDSMDVNSLRISLAKALWSITDGAQLLAVNMWGLHHA